LRKIAERASTLIDRFNVKTPTIETTTQSLSGGNIQKLIMARELSTRPTVLVASQPTRGVDIGAAEYIHRRLVEERENGTAILVISEDLDEILALADRVAVMFEGRLMGILNRENINVAEVGLLMAGVSE
jgi:simple sugar transport system ATP-binding protein